MRVTIDEERPMDPKASMELRGPVWSLDAACCGPCAGELGMLVASQTSPGEHN
jgi:hypothetical protein